MQDVRYALRTLRRSPGFTAVAVLALAIGIGGNTAIFSLVDSVRTRALPYPDPDRLVILWGNVMRATLERRGASYPDFLDWRAQSASFEGMAAQDGLSATLTTREEARRIRGEFVSAPYFSLLGVSAAQGRTFLPEEDVVPQKIAVAVISDGLWSRSFGRDPGIVGRQIQLNGRAYEVVGVMPAGFRGLNDDAEVWLPYVMSDTAEGLAQRGTRSPRVLARFKDGVTRERAQSEMDTISRRLEQQYPETNEKRGVEISPLDVEVLGQLRPGLNALMGAVGFVLLIACANIANLLIVRSETRQREIALRTALGAGWRRLLRQLVTESCVLTMIGAATGLFLATFAIEAIVKWSPVSFPSFITPRVNVRAAFFTVLISLTCGVALGLAPALHGRISRLAEALKDSVRTGDGRRTHRVRSALVVAEVSLAMALLVGAGLMIRSVRNLAALDPGFNPDSLLTLRVSIPRMAAPPSQDPNAPPPPLVAPALTLLERLKAIPGVSAASLSSDFPYAGLDSAIFYTAEGQPPVTAQNVPRAYIHRVTPEFFSTLGISLRAGRTFLAAEAKPNAPVVIVSERVVSRFWPGQDPIGKRIKPGVADSKAPWLSIVGVVDEVKFRGLPDNPTADPDLYLPFIDRVPQVSLALRTSVPPNSIVPSVRNAIRQIDPTIPLFNVSSMEDRISGQTSNSRFTSWLMGIFAGIALLLAVVGLYGVMSYLVSQRTREIGIRLALGATRSDVLRLIVGNGARLIGAGLLVGLGLSLVLGRLVRTLLFGVSAIDASIAIAIAVLAVVALAACYVPAVRASRVSPLRALRSE